ncbi:MAG: hypothetical protein ACRCSP_10040, partial [Rhodoglobus sp.]
MIASAFCVVGDSAAAGDRAVVGDSTAVSDDAAIGEHAAVTTTAGRTLIVLVGASGVGKTTLQRRAAAVATIVRRVTTRSLQNTEETAEISAVT